MNTSETARYGWENADSLCSHGYILPAIEKIIAGFQSHEPIRILDLGCGNGFVTARLAELGYSITGVDASPDGLEIARSAYPNIQFELCSIYDDALAEIVAEPVDCIISLEVVEHLYYPRKLFEKSFALLKSGGQLIVSTPYHGYLKNLSISILNGWDNHFGVDIDGGHIKFFSKNTLYKMAFSAGFENSQLRGVGRFPYLWKSMIMISQKGTAYA